MEYVATWMTNIVLFILLAIVVDMLLPNSAMQNYAKMVIGLLLILLILTPILRFFSEDFEHMLEKMEVSNFTQNEQLKSRLELKKKEIQADQQAYILEKTAVQMKESVQKELMDQYGYTIIGIDLELGSEAPENWTTVDLQALKVAVRQASTEDNTVESVQEIEPVKVNISSVETEDMEKNDKKDFSKVKTFLAAQWGIQQEKIYIEGN